MFKKAKFGLLVVAAILAGASMAMAGGPTSVTTDCSTDHVNLLTGVPAGQTFDLTDVTIANFTGSPVNVGITNTFTAGVDYVAGADSTVTQKFETPIRFVTPNPFFFCSVTGVTGASVHVSIQGVIRTPED